MRDGMMHDDSIQLFPMEEGSQSLPPTPERNEEESDEAKSPQY